MKYYVCITPFFPEPNSFVGPYVLDQVKAIAKNSEFEVLVFKPTSFFNKGEDYEYDGVKVYRFVDFTIPSNLLPNSISDFLTYRSFRIKLKQLGIDPLAIVACHSHVAYIGSTGMRLKQDFPNVKTIVQHHGFDVMSETDGRLAKFGWHKKLCQKHNIRICNEADLNVGVSSVTLSYVDKVKGADIKNSYVLYNGVDTALFSPKTTPKHNNRVFSIGCVANFWELKDHITLIKAVEILVKKGISDLKVKFIGTGYTRKLCEDYIDKNELQQFFEFIPTMHHSDLPDFYRSLDLFALPSYWEAFGCVYTEAYACGVPFIAVKGQGISEIIPKEDQDKWLIERGDVIRLASLIEDKISHPDKKQVLSLPIDIDYLIKKFLNIISTL